MKADRRLSPDAIRQIRSAIEEAGGNEVFFVGVRGEDGRVGSVSVGARGNRVEVPLLSPHLSNGDTVIHNHPPDPPGRPANPFAAAVLTPSGADLSIAARLGNQGMGFYIVDNAVEEVYVVAEPVDTVEVSPLDLTALSSTLEPGGALSRIFPSYEERTSQVAMMRVICEAFNGDEICAVEAGTGVGKSLAYLIPAIAWADVNKERVVISTNTINLQQQLIEKDIPLARKVLGSDAKAVLVKGRGNYLCKSRLSEALEEMSLFEERDPELLSIREWSLATETGDRSDLSFLPSEEAWVKVCSESDSCMGMRCRFHEGCYVLKARREAGSARLLVANHHLLFSDLAFRLAGSGYDDPAVLPPFKRVILDEAHNIEKAATSFFSESFSRFSIGRCLRRIYRSRKGRTTGCLVVLARHLGRGASMRSLSALVSEVENRASGLDAACIELMGEDGAFLLESETRRRFASSTRGLFEDLAVSLRRLSDAMDAIVDKLAEPEANALEGSVWDCRIQRERLQRIAVMCDKFAAGEPGNNDIYWMETLKGSPRAQERPAKAGESGGTGEAGSFARCTISPLSLAPLMREAVFEPFRTVILTSATLTVAGSFSFWAGRIGLSRTPGREVSFRSFPSPFNFRENVLLGVASDAPLPDSPGYAGFAARFTTQLLRASGGAGLVLFTSHALLREVHASVRHALADRGIRVMKQGDDDRGRLLEAFRLDRASVLCATDSFWEGIDAPGETLQIVILTRLPFKVPSEPVLKARMMAIEKAGGSSFEELLLPDAVVRMRQGFGRLMRKQDDRGVVVVLDPRIVQRPYGRVFLESLPETGRAVAAEKEVLAAVEGFFDRLNKKGEAD